MFDPRKFAPAVLSLGLAFSPFAAIGALAQDAQPAPQPAPAQPAAPAAEIDDAKLQSFVVAFLEVNKVGQQYQPQIEAAASDETERARIQEEASKKMVEAVENSGGISVQEYSAILSTAQSDPDLASKINAKIQENVGGETPAQPAEPNTSPAQ